MTDIIHMSRHIWFLSSNSLGAVILGPLADRFEPKRVLTGSRILTGIGCGILFLFSASTSVLLLMASLGILGFGLATPVYGDLANKDSKR